MRAIILLAAIAIPAIAHAGSVTISVQTSAGACRTAGACQKVYTVDDATLGTLANAFIPRCSAALPLDSNGNPQTCTQVQALATWADTVRDNAKVMIDNQNRATADATVTPSVMQ